LKNKGKLSEAIACLERAVELDPDDTGALATWFRERQNICDWSGFSENDAKVRQAIPKQPSILAPFTLLALSSSAEEQLACSRQAAATIAAHGRTAIVAYRPAPIQANHLGYPGTMGADFIDYIIVDRFLVPVDQQPFYTERLVQLPNCYQPNELRQEVAGRIPPRLDCGLPENGFVFCCFNTSYKITPTFFNVWMRLLRAVPGSVLWLVAANPLVIDNLRCEAVRRGVAAERLVFAAPTGRPQYLRRLALADLFLDTFPYNAGATASDALWAGLPVLTCSGETYLGRMTGALLTAAELPQLITTSLEAYERLALRLATEPGLLAGLRQRLIWNRPPCRSSTSRASLAISSAPTSRCGRPGRQGGRRPPFPSHFPPTIDDCHIGAMIAAYVQGELGSMGAALRRSLSFPC
jgi:predicted O-linked N-acetylglucosamine transferase (SPINDLY family)